MFTIQNDIMYFNSYDTENLTHTEWLQDVNRHYNMYSDLKELEFLNRSILEILINDNYNFWIKLINNDPYFYRDAYLIDLTLKYINKTVTLYINQSLLNTIIERKCI